MRKILSLALLLPGAALAEGAATPIEPLKPLAFLAGACWKGNFPGQEQTDEHCFEWLYGGRFLRDTHTVHGPGHPDYKGETTYYWDAQAQQVQYLYIESEGGFSRGTARPASDGVNFPETTEVENGKAQVYRSRWQHDAGDVYQVVTEFKTAQGWSVAWRVEMKRQPTK